MSIELHHIGLVVKSIVDDIKIYEALGYELVSEIEIDELQNNVTDLRELIQQMDKLVVRFDVTIKLMEKIMWGGVGGILIYFLNQLLRFI